MDPDKTAKFAIHEAAREGKSKSIIISLWLQYADNLQLRWWNPC
jgi:hypothetical protein